MNRFHVVCEPSSNEIWDRVTTHQICFVKVHHFANLLLDTIIFNITLDKVNTLYCWHGKEVNRDTPFRLCLGFDPLSDYLRPAAWCCTNVDDKHARL